MTKRARFIKFCAKFIGLPYIWGGADPAKGLDCSGYWQVIFGEYGLDPKGDQTADNLLEHCKKNPSYATRVMGGLEEAKLGDTLFFGKNLATHITIYAFDGLMFEAGGGNKFCTTPEIAKTYGACIKLSDVERRSDLIAIYRINGLNLEE